jgi:hypothetical protein
VDRNPPRTLSDEIENYIRTYYSLLRSSGEVRVRAFEEAHAYSNSSLHLGAREPVPDVAAFAYSAARLPACMPRVERVILGQSHEHFEAQGLEVRDWQRVRTRGRRRPLRWDDAGTLAVFITSTSDIDDLLPIVTAWQIEWNKMHERLGQSALGRAIAGASGVLPEIDNVELASVLGIDVAGVAALRSSFADAWDEGIRALAQRQSDVKMRLLAGSFKEYQRAAQRWWGSIEPAYIREAPPPRRRPVYFVSSNTHCLPNLLGGYARTHRGELVDFVRKHNPEGLAEVFDRALATKDEHEISNLSYYLCSRLLRESEGRGESRLEAVQAFDAEGGLRSIESPGQIDVSAQIIEVGKLVPDRIDPRIHQPGIELLRRSDAVIVNIDYPLGMAAYHHLSRLAQGVGELRGVYVMGKAATLNARVGDVMISTVAQDEHSQNTYLFRNCFAAADVQPWAREITVLDNQKALTVRSAFLQNREYMGQYYRSGYTVLEMEAGPYLSAIYEIVSPTRYPHNEVVHLSGLTPFDVGLLHYASDTPYSRRMSLLSKSLSYFGVESTYACAIAISRRILANEIARVG